MRASICSLIARDSIFFATPDLISAFRELLMSVKSTLASFSILLLSFTALLTPKVAAQVEEKEIIASQNPMTGQCREGFSFAGNQVGN